MMVRMMVVVVVVTTMATAFESLDPAIPKSHSLSSQFS